MKFSRRFSALALISAALLTSGCAATVTLEPAELANDPACADLIVRLPDAIGENGELKKRTTNAQSTAAWGNPAAVILRCGLPADLASDLPCVTTSDVDWIVDDAQKPNYTFYSFGRKVNTEVIVDSTKISGVSALDELAGAVKYIAAEKRCK